MINIGKFNTLKVNKKSSSGVYLSDQSGKSVLLADKKVAKYELGDSIDAFVFVDNDGHLSAVTQKPLAQLDEIAYLKVVSINYYGAFLNWGLAKDLFVPFSEQHHELEVGQSYFFKLFLDEKSRIVATTKIAQFLSDELTDGKLTVSQEVDLVIADETDLGTKAIVNGQYWGLLYKNEIFQDLRKGQKLTGFIKNIRDDFRLDLTLNKMGYSNVTQLTDKILKMLHDNGDELAVGDKSPPEQIYALFNVSKKVFKQAIGALYKQKKIEIEHLKIRRI